MWAVAVGRPSVFCVLPYYIIQIGFFFFFFPPPSLFSLLGCLLREPSPTEAQHWHFSCSVLRVGVVGSWVDLIASSTWHQRKALVHRNARTYGSSGWRWKELVASLCVCRRLERCVKELILIYWEDKIKKYYKLKCYIEADTSRPKIQTCFFLKSHSVFSLDDAYRRMVS